MESKPDTDPQEISLTNGTRIRWGQTDAGQLLRVGAPQDPCMVMHFTLTGTATARLGTSNLAIDIPASQSNIVYPGEADCWLDVLPGQPCQYIQILLSPDFFRQLSAQNDPTLQHLAGRIQTGQPLFLASANLPVTPAMRTVLAQITKCPLTCSLKRLFLEAKVLELLALQLQQYEQRLTATQATAHPPDYDKLVEARRLLEAHFDKPPTLAELSRLVGLNEFKLKKNFKEVFGETIHNWVLHYRLDRAYQLLQRHQLSVSEVAYQVGYQHHAHFTTAFKKRFGVVPSRLLTNLAGAAAGS